MQLKQASLYDGYNWFYQGFHLFRKNPVAMLLLITSYMSFSQLLILIPFVGAVAFVVLIPFVFLGLMTVCHAVALGVSSKQALVGIFSQLSTTDKRRLFGLGILHMMGMLLISLVVPLFVDMRLLVAIVMQQQAWTVAAMEQLYNALIAIAVLYLPIAILMWFAPLLVGWQKMTVMQSLFFSWLACWRNRTAFVIYIIIGLLAVVGVPLIVENILLGLGLSRLIPFLFLPYGIVVMAVFYCSVYASWHGCFQE